MVDDLCLAVESGFDPTGLPMMQASQLGPLLELAHTAPSILASGRVGLGRFEQLMGRLQSLSEWHSGTQGVVAVASIQANGASSASAQMRMKAAATSAGFAGSIAAQLVGAIIELTDNVANHSFRTSTGYVAYSARFGQFEFFVGDLGIGVLDSLRTNPQHSNLSDAGRALELALTEGVSRYSEPGHGFGFRPLFLGLANRSRLIRFRSADYGRVVSRDAIGDITSLTKQAAHLTGFCCSVICDLA